MRWPTFLVLSMPLAAAGQLAARQALLSSASSVSASPSAVSTSATPSASSLSASDHSALSSTITASSSLTKSAAAAAASSSVSGNSTSSDPDLVPSGAATLTASALPPNATTGQLWCSEQDAKGSLYPPICEPKNNSVKVLGNTYYIRWWPGDFPDDTDIQAKIDYINATPALNAWSSAWMSKSLGWVYLPITADLFKNGVGSVNVSLSLVPSNAQSKQPLPARAGPTIQLVTSTGPAHPAPPPNSINWQGLEIGLPVAFGAFILIIVGLFFGMRARRRIGIGNIMGRSRSRGYGVGKSRRQRLGGGGGRRKKGAAGLELGPTDPDFDASMPGFRDDPHADLELRERYHDADEMGTNGTNDPHGHDLQANQYDDGRPEPGRNVFREELARQEAQR